MSNTTSMSTPEDQVNLLMQEVAEEHQLDLAATLSNEAAVPGGAVAAAAQPVVEPADDLSGRLAPGGAATLSAYARDTRTPAVRHERPSRADASRCSSLALLNDNTTEVHGSTLTLTWRIPADCPLA